MITYRYYLTATLTLALMLGSCRAKKEERTEQSYHTEALSTEASQTVPSLISKKERAPAPSR